MDIELIRKEIAEFILDLYHGYQYGFADEFCLYTKFNNGLFDSTCYIDAYPVKDSYKKDGVFIDIGLGCDEGIGFRKVINLDEFHDNKLPEFLKDDIVSKFCDKAPVIRKNNIDSIIHTCAFISSVLEHFANYCTKILNDYYGIKPLVMADNRNKIVTIESESFIIKISFHKRKGFNISCEDKASSNCFSQSFLVGRPELPVISSEIRKIQLMEKFLFDSLKCLIEEAD